MKFVLHIIVFLLCSLGLQAQSIEDKRSLRTLFDNSKSLWFKSYQGSLDNVHPMLLTLATDGNAWKGWYTMQDENFKMFLEGSTKEDKLSLYEIDADENYCAVLNLDILGDDLEGQWKSVYNDQEFDIELSLSETALNPCQKNTIKIFEGRKEIKEYQLTISKEGERISQCMLGLNGANFELDPICKNENCNLLEADISDFGGKYKSISIKLIDSNSCTIRFGKEESTEPISLSLEQTLDFKCLESVNYNHKIDLVYPKINSEIFNNWITSEFREAIDLANQAPIEEDKTCKKRWSSHSFGWVDIHYFDKDIISGLLVYQLANKEEVNTKAFVFNLKDGKKLSEKSLFKKNENFRTVLRNHTDAYRARSLDSEEQLLSKPLKSLNYEHISLSKEGLLLTANFNTLLGTQNILIPYDDLEESLHKSISKKFLNN